MADIIKGLLLSIATIVRFVKLFYITRDLAS